MNIDVVARIRGGTPVDNGEPLKISNNRISAGSGGPNCVFQHIHQHSANNYDVFKGSAESLIDLFLAGFNTCLLIAGESGSGKSYTMAGESGSAKNTGLVQMILDTVFSKLAGERYMPETKVSRRNPVVSLQMYEVYNEVIKDLLHSARAGITVADYSETADKGIYVRNGTAVAVRDGMGAGEQFRLGWGRRTEASTDYGPASNNAAIVLYIDLQMNIGDNPQPTRSRFTVAELPGLERLSGDPDAIRLREGPTLTKALVALNQVVTTLSAKPFPDRVIDYSGSKLTQLLKEEIGGNCKTRGIVCVKPKPKADSLTSTLHFANNLGLVKNFPIVNDSFAQNLLTQYRAKIIELKHQEGVGPVAMTSMSVPELGEEVRRLQTENLVLKDQNERLQMRLDQMTNKFGTLANTKTDLSQQLLMSEEDKLRVSQSLVEMQIENNKIREENEATNFELTNKIIQLENALVEAEASRDKHHKAAKNAREKLAEMEKDRKDLADEYVVLKSNFLALQREHENEIGRNEELSIELLNLVNAKATLMRQVNALSGQGPGVGDPQAEINRVKALVTKNSSGRVKADTILGSQRERDVVEEQLFSSRRKFDNELERVKRDYADENTRLETRVSGIMKELQEQRNLARERQQKVSQFNAKVITLQGDKEALETQVNRLQHKVKDIGEDYRARLVKYVEDIAEFVDRGSGVPGQPMDSKMRAYVDSMLKDIRRSHREREEQLSQAAQSFKARLQKTLHKYEELLVAYRNLRQAAESRGLDPVDLGPDEHELHMTDQELQSAHMKELGRVKAELSTTKNEVDTLKLRYGLFGEKLPDPSKVKAGERQEMWGSLRKQMREFTLNTQQELEQERARLLSENQVLQTQLRESQDYIDKHLIRYKQEIIRLRRLLGMNDDGIVLTDRQGKIRRP